MLLKLLSYNSLNAHRDRMQDITCEFKSYHIALEGTGNRAANIQEVDKYMVGKLSVVSWGWSNKAKYSNRTCGVSISVDAKLFSREFLNAIHSPQARLPAEPVL